MTDPLPAILPLGLTGWLVRFADPLLGLAFGRIGDRAAGGLIDALDGERVDPPT